MANLTLTERKLADLMVTVQPQSLPRVAVRRQIRRRARVGAVECGAVLGISEHAYYRLERSRELRDHSALSKLLQALEALQGPRYQTVPPGTDQQPMPTVPLPAPEPDPAIDEGADLTVAEWAKLTGEVANLRRLVNALVARESVAA